MRPRLLQFLTLFTIAGPLAAQVLTVGFNNPYYGGNVNPSVIQTTLQLDVPVKFAGEVTTATFGWSASPCPAAVKIKFFRLWGRINVFHPTYTFSTERGPFDVTQPIQSSSAYPPVTQTVRLDPPVAVHEGDVIAITNLTNCGGPTYIQNLPSPLPPWGTTSLTVPGDANGDIYLPPYGPPLGPPVFLAAFGTTSVLPLLSGRFQVTLLATDPRTGAAAIGTPNQLGDRAGYFSLPDFTGDPQFPEVIVKMADATGVQTLGGTFWFFHAPLTDVLYTLTVRDLSTGAVKTYSNGSVSPGQLCGGVDTTAFPGP